MNNYLLRSDFLFVYYFSYLGNPVFQCGKDVQPTMYMLISLLLGRRKYLSIWHMLGKGKGSWPRKDKYKSGPA